MSKKKMIIATTNKGKAREIARIFVDLPVEFIHLGDSEFLETGFEMPIPEPLEDRDTFEGNAIQKAEHYAKLTRMPTIAEDAGLEIPILDCWPGVYSSRVGKSDPERIALVLDRLKGKSGDERKARFVSVAAYCDLEINVIETFTGICEGILLDGPRGENGFGYDPIFYHPGYGRTLAEVTTEEKNRVSHRGQSFRALAEWLREHLESKMK